MNEMTTEDTHVILRRLFKAVGEQFNPNKRYHEGWYREHSWTAKQERQFRDWLVKHLQKKFGWTKRLASKEAAWFLFDYGWKTEE
jgi:hypothetical protein